MAETAKNNDLILSDSKENLIAELYTGSAENTFFKSPLVYDSFRPPYNPDDLWQKKGDYSIYEDMTKDDQVSVCLRLKKDLILGDGGMFVSEESGQEEIVNDLESAFFEDYEGDFNTDLDEILTAYEFGFSITEKIFKVRSNGKIGLKYLRTRHPNSWRLHQDDKGNVTKFEQVTTNGDIDINSKSIIHLVNDSRFQNPYGNSDLRAAYNAWFTKRQIVKYFGIFLEKAASPIPYGKYDKNAPPGTATKLLDILKRFQSKTAIAVPKDVELEFLQTTNTGEAYVKAIHLFNMFIGRSLFVPDLIGFTGSETGGGSHSLGKEQMNLFFKHIIRRKSQLEAIINKHITWPIVVCNYGFVKNYPKFRFKPIDDMLAIELAKLWLDAVKGKAYQPNPEEINHFRKLTKFPEGETNLVQNTSMEGLGKNNLEKIENESPNEESDKTISNNDALDVDDSDNKTSGLDEDKKEFAKAYDQVSGDYYKKVNFKAVETKLNDYDESLKNESLIVIKKMILDLFDQIEKKKIVQNQNVDRIDSLNLKYKKDLKLILKSSFSQLYKDAKSQASSEILKSEFAKPVADEKFMEIIESETFKFVGDYEYEILKKTRNQLIAAIKDGKPLSQVLNDLEPDLLNASQVKVERYARTKHTEVLNNARVDFFQSTGVVAAYQYSAILDDRTSDICSGLHGKIFKAGSEPIPPMHFNCRSLLVPITKYEEFKPTETIRGKSVNDFIEENKGDGFSTK